MDLIQFPEQTTTFAKEQPQYQPLPAHVFANDPQGRIAFCWKLTWKERLLLLFTGKLWHQVLTFEAPLQPQMMGLAKPKMKTRFRFAAWTCFRFCLTWCMQSQGAPFVDKCDVTDYQGRKFVGYCFVLRFWRMKQGMFGKSDCRLRTPEPMAALVIAWERKPEHNAKPMEPETDAQDASETGASAVEFCPSCKAPEIDAMTPRTVYACGSSDYDQRPGTFTQSDKCKGAAPIPPPVAP